MTADEEARYIAERSAEKREHTGIRLSKAERAELDNFAERRGLVNRKGKAVRSAALRLRNAWAIENPVPDDWRPKAEASTE